MISFSSFTIFYSVHVLYYYIITRNKQQKSFLKKYSHVFVDYTLIKLGGVKSTMLLFKRMRQIYISLLFSRSVVSSSLQPHRLYVACQAPLSMGFPRQEYSSGLPVPSPGDLPHPRIEPVSPASQADSFPLSHQGSPRFTCTNMERRLYSAL